METGKNVCLKDHEHEKIVSDLAKAAFVKTLMADKGLSLPDALRELAHRMRRVQSHKHAVAVPAGRRKKQAH